MNEQQTHIAVMNQGTVVDMLRTLDRGFFLENLEEACAEVVSEVILHRKKGKIMIELEFDMDRKLDAVMVFSGIKKKLPPKPTKASIFFPTPDGKLSRQDTRQREMFVEGN